MARAALFLAAMALGLSACGGNGEPDQAPESPTPSALATPTIGATPAPTPSATPEPTPEPTVEIAEAEVLGFSQIGDEVAVHIRNPNEHVGLVRAGFDLALLDASGAIITVVGGQGLPGAPCCTIYQLPPGGEFVIVEPFVQGQVDSVELTTLGGWEDWSALDPAEVTVTNQSVQPDPGFGGPTVTGRVAVDAGGPYNVRVMAFVDTPEGQVVAAGVAECVTSGGPRAFEVRSFADVRGPYTLGDVIAYTTTVAGAGDGFTPDC